MKISAVIAEYNPLHRGHAYHMAKTRRQTGCDALIVLMSGNFVQRGEPAVFDKWTRARLALRAGADLVIELPVSYACASAERFASGAVAILNGLRCIDALSFGSETANLSLLQELADMLAEEPPAYRAALADALSRGLSFPAARSQAVQATFPHPEVRDILASPNAILGLEYLKALKKTGSSIRPAVIPRRGSQYLAEGLDGEFSSALAIRRALREGRWAEAALTEPPEFYPPPVFPDSLSLPLLYALRCAAPGELSQIYGMAEGLENKLAAVSKIARNREELLAAMKSRRHPYTRLSRLLLACFFGITTGQIQSIDAQPPYARVLGIRQERRDLLSHLAQHSRIPVITQPREDRLSPGLALDIRASDLYGLLCRPIQPAGRDYTQGLLIEPPR